MPSFSTAEPNIVKLCQQSQVGKMLPDALYVHVSALPGLDSALQEEEKLARRVASQAKNATIVKFSFNKRQVSYLFYPSFDTEPHPALVKSLQVNLQTLEAKEQDYSTTANPPVLHRKETFVAPDYIHYASFAWLTKQEEALDLLKNPSGIGFRKAWEQRLRDRSFVIQGHALACLVRPTELQGKLAQAKPKIQRHKAAIARVKASKPVRLAVEAGLFPTGTTYFDYGCGRGIDIEYIKRLGLASTGWDPHFRPKVAHTPADVVNLGYIINVIEDTVERRDALLKAWGLAQKVLIVAAQVLVDDRTCGVAAYGDGIITSRNTFQKYYEQEELKFYIDQVLGVDAIPVALGIYFVFRDDAQAQIFRASRFRSRATAPRIRLKVSKFEEYRELLKPLIDFYTDRGRLPTADEMDGEALSSLQAEFGSVKRAFNVILKATDVKEWDAISDKRRNDLLVYLALSHFEKRPKFKNLSSTIRADIKALFGSYQQACTAADLMLMSLGQTEMLADRCRQSPIGQQRPKSLWVHVSALEQLDPLLRLYEGCASRTIGRSEEATVVKFHIQKPRITYLAYPNFDKKPHPELHTSMTVELRDLRVRYRDYDLDNPPLLHQKEQLVSKDYPNYTKFSRLSQQEKKWGLLEDVKAIFDRQGWERCLAERGAELRGHRLVRRKN